MNTQIQNGDNENSFENDSKSKSNKSKNGKSEYSFKYVAKKNSTNFQNIKGADLENYSELGHSVINTPKITNKNRFNMKEKKNIRQRLPKIDQSIKDSFFDNLENLSAFSKTHKTPNIQNGKVPFENDYSFTPKMKRSGTSTMHDLSKLRQSALLGNNKFGNIKPVIRSVTPGVAELIGDLRQEMLEKDLDERFNLGRIEEEEKEHIEKSKRSINIPEKNEGGDKKREKNDKEDEEDDVKVNKIAESPSSTIKKEKVKIDKEKRQKRLEKLLKEPKNKITQDTEVCLICMDNKPNSIFHPCGHGGFCFECATCIVESNALCHYCRGVFNYFLIFFRTLRKF